jgi:hypothetical protein
MSSNAAVMGLFRTTEQMRIAVQDLQCAGFGTKDLSVVLQSSSDSPEFSLEHRPNVPRQAVAGIGAGGAFGGTLGLLLGLCALTIPGLGLFAVAGPILGAFTGAAAGAAVVGLAGALVGLGMPEGEAKQYEGKVGSGSVLLAVHVEDSSEQRAAKTVLEGDGAADVVSLGEPPAMSARG